MIKHDSVNARIQRVPGTLKLRQSGAPRSRSRSSEGCVGLIVVTRINLESIRKGEQRTEN
jgi:hypothetical protein